MPQKEPLYLGLTFSKIEDSFFVSHFLIDLKNELIFIIVLE